MAIKINFDVAHRPEEPTFILAKKSGDKLGKVNAKSIEINDSLNDASEITFNVYKYTNGEKDPLWDSITNFKLLYCTEWDCWFEITVEIDESSETKKTVFCTQLEHAELGQIMLYNIAINTDGEDGDIARDDYVIPTVLYRKDVYDITESDREFYKKVFKKDLTTPFDDYQSASLLHRILKDKAPHYSVAHVDSTIAHTQRMFEFDDTSIYDALQEIAEEINCLFVFDAYIDNNGIFKRTISVYDLESNCNSCGYRGEFFDKCPECDSSDIKEGYGEDTTIFVTSDEIANDIQLTTEVDEIKNCFKLEAGDEYMTATIKNCNPNGSDYIWYLSDDMKNDMSEELVNAIAEYDARYIKYQNTNLFDIFENDESLLKKYNVLIDLINISDASEYDGKLCYNDLVDKYNTLMKIDDDDKFETIDVPIIGFKSLINALYNTMDMEIYLRSGLMPTINTARPDIEEMIEKLTAENLSPVAVNVTSSSSNPLKAAHSSTVDNIVLSTAKSLVDSRYKVKIEDGSTLSDYEDDERTRIWRGRITLTAYTDDEITKTTDILEIEVNNDYETYIKRKLDKALSEEDVEDMSVSGLFKKDLSMVLNDLNDKDLYDNKGNRLIIGFFPEQVLEDSIGLILEDNKHQILTTDPSSRQSFESALKEYSLARLKSFYEVCNSCLEIMQEMNVTSGETWGKDLYDKLYMPYYYKLKAIEYEIAVRDAEIALVAGIYDENGDLLSNGVQTLIEDIKSAIQDNLDFEKFLRKDSEKLWIEFCSFRREDKYSNDNYISDGKSNADVIELANEFINVAKKEIYKSAELQCSISANLKNLLVIDKFKPLVDRFSVGNWLRVMVDDEIYKLRLIKYEIDYESLDEISVEFADTVRANSSVKSVQDVLAQASSMATSYSSVKRQASQGKKSNDIISDWVGSGLDATNVKIMGGADGQSQSWDKHGMLFREYDESIGDYLPEQMKIINSTMAITTDNWQTTKTAVGKYYYQDPDTKETKVAYGLNADTIVGKLILGQNIDLRNESGTLTFDNNGLVVQNNSHVVSINPDEDSIFNISKKIGEDSNSILSFDDDGNLEIKGKLIAANKNDISIEMDNGDVKGLHDVSISGNYADLEGIPQLHSVATSGKYDELEDKPELFSGDYNDLSNKPTIPTVPSTATLVEQNGTTPVSGKAVYDYAIAKNQGVANAGKLLYVNVDGSVTTLSINDLKTLLGI